MELSLDLTPPELAGASDVDSGDMEKSRFPWLAFVITVRRAGRGKSIREVISKAVPTNKQVHLHD